MRRTLVRLLVHEHADLFGVAGQRGGYLLRPVNIYPPGAFGEDQTDGVRTGTGRQPGVFHVGYSADFHQGHGSKFTPYPAQTPAPATGMLRNPGIRC